MTKHLLVVDDEPDILAALKRMCARNDLPATLADSASMGLEKLADQDFDIVITDIVMPDQNGVAFIKQIKDAYPAIKIIAISGGGEQGAIAYKPAGIATSAYLKAAHDAGADRVLTKPFTMAEILNAINTL